MVQGLYYWYFMLVNHCKPIFANTGVNQFFLMNSKTPTYKIGETARRAGVNRETIRYYERRKLIDPPDRRRSGYRIFTKRHIDQIKFIKRAQELGFTLEEIRELLALRLDGTTNCGEIRKKAETKQRDMQQKVDDLQHMQQVLNSLIRACKADGKTEDCVILNALEGNNKFSEEL